MSDNSLTKGAHHIGLTVPNLAATRAFFTNALAFETVGDVPDYPAVFLSDGTVMITLWQAKDPSNAVSFDRHNIIGLHHLALTVDGIDALGDLHRKFQRHDGVEIEFSPQLLGGGPAQHMMCSIPGGIRTEFIAPAG